MPERRRRQSKKLPFKPFDVTTKQLVEADPLAWVRYVGLPRNPVQIIDADLSTIAVAADKVIRVEAAQPYLLNLEFQSTYEEDLGDRVLLYSVLLRRRHRLPVKTVVLLLRPEADGPAMTGRVQEAVERPEDADFALSFAYRIVRVWQQPVESLLAGPLVMLPLAPLSNLSRDRLPEIIGRMQKRIEGEADPRWRKELWGATFLLMGLRYDAQFIEQILKGVQGMEESTTYQLLLSRGETKGRSEEARKLLVLIGQARLGEPDQAVVQRLAAMTPEQLEQLAVRLLQVETWQELLT